MLIARASTTPHALRQECHVYSPRTGNIRSLPDMLLPVLQNPHARRSRKSYLMANTFSQIYIQTVFAVSGRLSLITSDFKEELHKYITGIVTKQGQKLIRINGMSDHLHILIGLKPAKALADLVRDIKSDSSEWINKKKLARGKFAWQEGYGAFSYGHSQLV